MRRRGYAYASPPHPPRHTPARGDNAYADPPPGQRVGAANPRRGTHTSRTNTHTSGDRTATYIPWLLCGEAVVHFVDNTGALSNLIHGYASKPDCGRLVNALHLALAFQRTRVWFEWVPSKANVADYPSRDDDRALVESLVDAGIGDQFVEVGYDLPPMASWSASLAEFAGV